MTAAPRLLGLALAAAGLLPSPARPEPPTPRTSITTDLYGRYGPEGIFLAVGLVHTRPQADGPSPLEQGRYLQLGLSIGSSPGTGALEASAEWVPVAPLQLRLRYDLLAYYGAFKALLRFPSADSPFGPSELEARRGQEEAGIGHRVQLSPVLRYRAGRLLLRNQTDLSWYRPSSTPGWYYEPEYDTLVAQSDLVVYDQLSAPVEVWRGAGDAVLLVGPAYSITHGVKADLTRQRIEALAYWAPVDRLGRFSRPRVVVLAGVNVRDRNRQGEVALAVGMGADLDL